ncbi:MAG: PASTA domain-containing protein, partial [Cellulomonas sp.]|nr:PASTA domain-containing protein [Cellulomonas sp.]
VPKTASEAAGTVIRQDPSARSKVDKGAKVTLTVSAGPGQAMVPELSGQPRLGALAELKSLGFKTEVRKRPDASIGRNRVIESSPAAGQRVDKGQTVTLLVSSGPQRVAVPSVVGQSQEAASSALSGAGFRVSVRTKERKGVDPGTVLGQDPAAGTRRPQGARVTITVATAPKQVTVPDVVGLEVAEAARTLSGAGFEVRQTERQSENPADDGKVLAQSPAGGRDVKPGGAVTLTVGKFDKSQIVPTPSTPSTPPPTTTPPTGATGP